MDADAERDLGWEAECHGDEGAITIAGGVERGGPGGVEAGTTESIADDVEDEYKRGDEADGDEDVGGEAVNIDSGSDEGGEDTHRGYAEHP